MSADGIDPSDRAGLVGFGNVLIAGDADHYVYTVTRQLSHLYLLKLP